MNKQPESQSKNKFVPKKLIPIVGLTVLGLIVLWLSFTVAVPMMMGDGLSGYTGTKLTAAQHAVNNPQGYIDNKLRWSYNFHVDEVRPVSSAEIAQSCHNPSFITQDPNNVAYYTVVVSQRRLLQFGSETKTYIGCDSVSQY